MLLIRDLCSLDVLHFITQYVTDMSDMFSECSSLINLNISNFNTQNVKNMQYMFTGCSSLTNLNLSNMTTRFTILKKRKKEKIPIIYSSKMGF